MRYLNERKKYLINIDNLMQYDDRYTIFCDYESIHNYLKSVLLQLSCLLNDITKTNIFNDIDFNLENDRALIINYFNVKELENSLFNKYPNIVKDWDYKKTMLYPQKIYLLVQT